MCIYDAFFPGCSDETCLDIMFVWMEGHRTDEKGEGMEMMRFSFHSRSL